MYIPAGMELLHKDKGDGLTHTDNISCECCPRLVTHEEASSFRALGGYMAKRSGEADQTHHHFRGTKK